MELYIVDRRCIYIPPRTGWYGEQGCCSVEAQSRSEILHANGAETSRSRQDRCIIDGKGNHANRYIIAGKGNATIHAKPPERAYKRLYRYTHIDPYIAMRASTTRARGDCRQVIWSDMVRTNYLKSILAV